MGTRPFTADSNHRLVIFIFMLQVTGFLLSMAFIMAAVKTKKNSNPVYTSISTSDTLHSLQVFFHYLDRLCQWRMGIFVTGCAEQ